VPHTSKHCRPPDSRDRVSRTGDLRPRLSSDVTARLKSQSDFGKLNESGAEALVNRWPDGQRLYRKAKSDFGGRKLKVAGAKARSLVCLDRWPEGQRLYRKAKSDVGGRKLKVAGAKARSLVCLYRWPEGQPLYRKAKSEVGGQKSKGAGGLKPGRWCVFIAGLKASA
jgi:hypothetical protein